MTITNWKQRITDPLELAIGREVEVDLSSNKHDWKGIEEESYTRKIFYIIELNCPTLENSHYNQIELSTKKHGHSEWSMNLKFFNTHFTILR